jgi:hypothetical protein
LDLKELAVLIKNRTFFKDEDTLNAVLTVFESLVVEADQPLPDGRKQEMCAQLQSMQLNAQGNFKWLLQQVAYYHPCWHCVDTAITRMLDIGFLDMDDVKQIPQYRMYAAYHGAVFHA